MKLTGTYNGKPIELELTEEQVEVLKQAEKKKTGWERVKEGETFWCAGTTDTAFEFQEVSSCRDDKLFSDANYFSDATLAQNIIRVQELQRKLWRRSAELCKRSNLNGARWFVFYNPKTKELDTSWSINGVYYGTVFFDTKEHTEQAIKEFKDELIWYFTEFQSRMD